MTGRSQQANVSGKQRNQNWAMGYHTKPWDIYWPMLRELKPLFFYSSNITGISELRSRKARN